MARYELIIERKQPTCGGRAPTSSEVRMVEVNDPMAYVQEQEPNLALEKTEENGVITISGVKNGLWFKYEFTED
ncbi:MAG: hypothetical protein J6M10_02910 [Clostridia bacterium]|nr:hypothetical protein [Clostridia bacterium]